MSNGVVNGKSKVQKCHLHFWHFWKLQAARLSALKKFSPFGTRKSRVFSRMHTLFFSEIILQLEGKDKYENPQVLATLFFQIGHWDVG